MDKPSERKADSKKWGDTDVNTTRDFGAGGERQTLDDLWSRPTITGGSIQQRIAGNNYCKEAHAKYEKGKNEPGGLLDALLESADTHGPPLMDESKPNRVL
jgi:hypothetical protein